MDQISKSDNELMQEFSTGSFDAFEEIVNRYKKRLFNYLILGLITDKDWAEDIVQDTFEKVFKCKYSYKPTHQFSTWIYTICRNLALNSKRNKRTIDLDTAFYGEEPGNNTESIAQEMEKEETSGIMKDILSKLDSKFRDVITLRYIDGLSYEEISVITGKGKNTLKSLCKRGLERIRKEMEGPD